MSIETLNSEPLSFIAGNTVKWKKSFSDFPASDGWSLSYAMVKDGNLITFDASVDGDDFLITIAASTSASYSPGVYSYQATVSDGTDKYTACVGKIEILPDFSQQTTGYDNRSLAKQMIDTLETLFPKMAAKGFASYSVAGRSGTYRSMEDLQAAYKFWSAKYYAEERRAGRFRSRIIRPVLR